MFKHCLYLAAISLITTPALAHNDHKRPDDHAPIGVMGDHTHAQGEWMFSYRYSSMHMAGNRDGSNRVSTASVLSNFMVAPTEMDMEMHMFGAMFAPTDSLTLMAMLPYVEKSMTHVTRMGGSFTTESNGFGDLRLSGLYTLYDGMENHQETGGKLHIKLGASLPTGSIDERDDTPAMRNAKLPYPMQLGSGTVDPLLGITWVQKETNWSWGADANAVLRVYDNSDDYHLGNEYLATLWAARPVSPYMSLSARLEARHWGDIRGADAALNPMMVPTARTDLRGGERVDALFGVNLYTPEGAAAGNRLALEFGLPLYQHLDGPQLETDYRFTVGWQYAF